MRTQVIPEHALGLPWLEHYPAKGGPSERTILDKSPFIIGRGESADLQVVHHGVSREHAAVVREGGATRIRDLDSTNGTFVNGQRIKEADLHNGDMVQVANVEFAFYCSRMQAWQGTVTQILSLDADSDAGADCGDPAGDLRRTVRRLHETLVSGCVPARLRPIVELRQGQLAGYEPLDDDVPPAGSESRSVLPAIPGRVAARLRHLRRMRGVEEAMAMPGEFLVFVNLQGAEVVTGRLLELASGLCELLPDPRRLVVAVPYAVAKDAPQALLPGSPLRELGIAVALSNLGDADAGDAAMAVLTEIHPDFVRLAASLVTEIAGNARNSRAVRAIIRAVGESGTKVIATGIGSPSERASCLEVGCELGQGALFEKRKRADAPPRRASLRGSLVERDVPYLSPALDSIRRS